MSITLPHTFADLTGSNPAAYFDDNFQTLVGALAEPTANQETAPTLTIVSNRIAPTTNVCKVGAGLIKNITVPATFAGTGGSIKIRPTAAFTTDTTGNIALATTAQINRTLEMTYDDGDGKWTPSYT